MRFDYRYLGNSAVSGNASSTDISFAPDTLRAPTYFVANLNRHIPFREAISALNAVVVSDLRFQPKDRDEYFAWLKEQEESMLAEFMSQSDDLKARTGTIRSELQALRRESSKLMGPFLKAQNRYFKYLYQYDMDAWYVLDPVITVHPDQVFFECFSQDESTYGCLRCNHDTFDRIGDFACGTTNIDYSAGLYNEFQKIRDYKATQFKVDPGGFEIETGDDDRFIEQKIDLPESWVRGFLQVSSAMTLPLTSFSLHPMEVHNLLFVLRRRKERVGPRSIRFRLTPGEPVVAVFEPWNREVVCSSSVYAGSEANEIRIWGRRRLLMLERLLPIAHSFSVHLLGSGMPSFFVAHMPDMSFTLGLSGWTANDWSRAGNFDLMAPRAEVDTPTKERVYKSLEKVWFATAEDLGRDLNLAPDVVRGALSLYTQAGRVVYDLANDVYRLRELSREPLPMKTLRFSNPREAKASRLVSAGLVEVLEVGERNGQLVIRGKVTDDAKEYSPQLVVDTDQRLWNAECSCDYHFHNKLYKGPCEHILAVRSLHAKQAREAQADVA